MSVRPRSPAPSPAGSGPARSVVQSRGHPHRRYRLAGGIVLIILLIAGFAAWQMLSARAHLLSGVTDLRRARAALSLNLSNGSFQLDPQARVRLSAASTQFGAARSDLQIWSPLLVHLGWVPRVGTQIAAAPPAADAAWYATQSALHLAGGLTELDTAARAHSTRHNLLARLGSVLQHHHRQFQAAAADAGRLSALLRHFPSTTGNASLTAAVGDLRRAAPLLAGTSRWLAIAPDVLGFDGPSHYLVLLQNPAESRATGGFIGAVDFVTLDHGSAHMLFSSSALSYEISTVPTPLPMAPYTPEGWWILRDSNWSPDFSLSARTARWFYGEDTGRWAQGVMGFQDTGIKRLLAVSGPVYLKGYRRWVTAGNVDSLSQHYVNGGYHGPSQGGSPDTVRKQFLGQVIKALIQRLQTLPRNRLPALGRAIAAMASSRQLQVYDRRPAVRSAIATSRIGGRFGSTPGDFLSVVDTNLSYSKINPYVRETARYSVTVRHDLWFDSTLTIRYHVDPSPNTLEGAGPGYGLEGNKHDYEDFLRVYVPAGTQLLRMTGVARWAPAPAYGMTQLAGQLIVRKGQTRTVTIRYRVPANALLAAGLNRYRLTVRPQPGSGISKLTVSVKGARGIRLSSSQVTRTLPPGIDTTLDVPLAGRIAPRPVSITRPAGPVDPYIPFGQLHAPHHPL